ncbi:hypothetical protein GDO86_012629 [Hymenochirus boettgeri]|uniref:Uncharacterized protein n=1 Tax=Hymenochirus boettgeri TaxID=247094 RepID=A0A8T2ITI4_9PIPI|nr:hypothetical protein GDO86_012629 [Hymenochirus boettgeri]
MDVTSGSAVYQLLSAAKTFKEIYVSEFTDGAIKEFHKWLNKEHGAHDWSYPAKFLAELEDKGDTWEENEDNVRRAIKKVVKWDICGGPLQPHEVPQVDCVISFWVLQKISKTKEEFKNNLKNVVSQIKKGGWLIIFTALNMSYYRFGKNMDKHFFLAIDGNFLRAAVIDAGLVIAKFEILPRSKVSDVLDHDSVAFLLANKKLGG